MIDAFNFHCNCNGMWNVTTFTAQFHVFNSLRGHFFLLSTQFFSLVLIQSDAALNFKICSEIY